MARIVTALRRAASASLLAYVLTARLVFAQSADASLSRGTPLPALAIDTYPTEARVAIAQADEAARARPGDAAAVGGLAKVLHAWEQWGAARQAYARAAELAPREFEWAYLQGVVLQRLADQADAARAFRHAVDLRPDYLPARTRLAEALFEAGDFEESARLYKELENEPAVQPVAAFGLGRLAMRANDYPRAIAHLQRAVELFPEFGAAHYALALALRATGRTDEARGALARHQEFGTRWPGLEDPILAATTGMRKSPSAQLSRGLELAERGDVPAAIAAHEEALARDPSLSSARINLMALYGRAKNWTAAEEQYRAALKGGFDLDEAHYNFGVLLGLQERWSEAATAYRQAIAVNPAHAEAHNNLGQILERERRWEEAAREYQEALKARPGFRLARFNLGRMLIAQGRADEAIAVLERLRVPEDAETPRYVFALATAHVRAGHREEGLKWAAEARRIALLHNQQDLVAAIDRDVAGLK